MYVLALSDYKYIFKACCCRGLQTRPPQLEMAMIIRQNERFRSVLWVRVIKNKYFCKLKLSNNTYKNIHLHSCLSK